MSSVSAIDLQRLGRPFDVVRESVGAQRGPSTVLAVATAQETLRCEAFVGDAATPVQADSIFYVASISKPLMATAILRLVADGLLALEDPIDRYLPQSRGAGKSTITVWQLLTHTSGLPEYDWATALRERPSAADMRTLAYQAHLLFPPGTSYSYSTQSFWLLADLVALLSGISYADYLRAHVCSPYGMRDTGFDLPTTSDRVAAVRGSALGHPMGDENAAAYLISLGMPGAGIWTTAADLVSFGQGLLHDLDKGGLVLSPPLIELMTREQTTGLTWFGSTPPRPAHYGLGWEKGTLDGTLPGSHRSFGHTGATGARLWIDPDWDLVVVFLINQWDDEVVRSLPVLGAIYGAVRRHRLPTHD